MLVTEVSTRQIGKLLGLKKAVTTLDELEAQVEAGLPKVALESLARHVFGPGPQATAFVHRVIPSATLHRRSGALKPQESERVERLARVIATAEHVWADADDARTFLLHPHEVLNGRPPIEVALTELGARRVEQLLWSLFYGLAA